MTTATTETTGDRIRRRREALGMSKVWLGMAMCGDRNQVWEYEQGRQLPRAVQAVLLARALGVTVEWLLEPAVNQWLADHGYGVDA